MVLRHAMWIHGHSLRVEEMRFMDSVRRHGSSITLIGKPNSRTWFHIAIPTPVVVDEIKLHLDSIRLRFRTAGATITIVDIYDGHIKLKRHDGLSYTSTEYCTQALPPGDPDAEVFLPPLIHWGVGISFLGVFGGATTDRRIEVSSAGADFC